MLLPKKSDSVNYEGVVQPILDAMQAIADYYKARGLKATCTSAKDGAHSKQSAHYFGRALDLRTWGVKSPDAFCRGLHAAVKPVSDTHDFYVVWEDDHIHLEAVEKGKKPNIIGYAAGQYVYAEKGTLG